MQHGRGSRALACFGALVLAASLFLVGSPAQSAQLPGTNGNIVVDTGTAIGIVNINTLAVTTFPGTVGGDSDPEWDPNGNFIVIEAQATGTVDRVPPSGAPRTTIVPGAGANTDPAVSPDGSRVVYECPGGICVINSDGTGGSTLLPGTAGGDFPDFTPDGTQVVYDIAGTGLFRTPAAGGAVTQIAGSLPGDNHPRVLANGSAIVFNSAAGITTLPFPAGGARTVLTGTVAGDTQPHPSPDGNRVAFHNGTSLLTLNLPGGGGRTTLVGGSTATEPAWQRISAGPGPGPGTNNPPTFSAGSPCGGTALFAAFGGGTATYSATDPNPGQTVTLSASGLPSWATFNPATGTITGTPSILDWLLGLFGTAPTVTVTATDNGTPQQSATCTTTLRIRLFTGSPFSG